MKRTLTKYLALILCLLTLCVGFAPSAYAAGNACKQISGSSKAVEVFTVSTGKRWIAKKDVVKLTQTKGVMKTIGKSKIWDTNYDYYVNNISGNKATGSRKMYERYTVKVERLDKKGRVIASKSYIFDEGSLKLKLEKNSKYRITITPEFIGFYRNMMDRKYYINHLTYNPYGLKYPQGNEVTRFASLVAVGKWKPLGWSTHSTWKVTSTKGISECAFNR